MITLCSAIDDTEVMFIRALLQHQDIPFHIVGENFGSLFPGVQISSYNERIFRVAEADFDRATHLLNQVRDEQNTDS